MTIDRARRSKALALWHRRFAVLVSLWLVLLAASGLLINHAHDWGFDSKPLPATLQQWIYGIELENDDFCSAAADIGPACSGVFARFPLPMGSLLLDEYSLFLIDDSGRLVEKLAAGQLGLGSLQAAYLEESHIFLRDRENTVRTDAELMDWVVLGPGEAVTMNDRDWQVRDGAGTNITWERLLQDLHAARFLGPLSKAFNDLMAVLILVLAISGLWLYRLKRNGNGGGKSSKT